MNLRQSIKSAFNLFIILGMVFSSSILMADLEKIPMQEELNALFAGDFCLDTQVNTTFTKAELEALDKALAAMNMTRHDMNFRKDYTDPHLPFPLILDMLKHPLHIAPYMDGFINSIDVLKDNDTFPVHQVLASAMMHPGVDLNSFPDFDQIKSYNNAMGNSPDAPWKSMNPRPSEKFIYVLNAFAIANKHVENALKDLEPDELAILRLKIPSVITWRDIYKSPFSDDETERLNKIIEDINSESYIDELATKVNLTEMLLAYVSLPNPYILIEMLDESDFPKIEPLIYDTPWGRMAIGTTGNDYYTGDFAIIIEPGGDDVYENCRIGGAYGTDHNHIGFFLDMDGKDQYFCDDINVTFGSAILGVAAFYDLGGENDIYRGGNISQGAAICGIASFFDDGGSDNHSIKVYGQGAGGYGIGVMVDAAPKIQQENISPANLEDAEIEEQNIQNDRFNAWLMAQGFSRQWGVGVCHGSRGNDIYYAGGVYLHAPLFNDRYQSFSQGFSIGSRGINYAGGIAFLIDDSGNDYYLGDIYNQGVGYWYAGGFLYDKDGNDHYEMTQYGQGSGIHLAVGGLIDNSGNDSYVMNSGLGQGGSHDYAASIMMDRAGNDRYLGSTSCNGSGLTNSVGLFFDRDGDDIYGADPNASSLGGGRPARDTGSIGIFVDTGGRDFYTGRIANDNRLWTQTSFGAGIDFKAEDLSIMPDEETTAQQTEVEPEIDIPEICFYEGDLTQEVFDDLWAISVRWEVGDNRYITPKARDRLIEFGIEVLPYIDRKFDDAYGLAARAYEVIIPALYDIDPDEVKEMLVTNLKNEDDGRVRNALTLIGLLQISELDTDILPLLENEELQRAAIYTLGALGSSAGNDIIKQLLATDSSERLVILAASTLLKLDQVDIYSELRNLLDHEFFTVREGIIPMIANYRDHFHTEIYRDLSGNQINNRTRINLLRVLEKYPEFFPSLTLYNIVENLLDHDNWVMRAHAVKVLKTWLTYESEQWTRIQKMIRERLDNMKHDETDIHIKFLLDDI